MNDIDIINEALKRQKDEYKGGNTETVPNLDYIMENQMGIKAPKVVKITKKPEYKKAQGYADDMELTVYNIIHITDVKKAQEAFKAFFKLPTPKV